MKQYIHYIVVLVCLIATFLLYNQQLGAAPLLLLSIYLFYLGIRELYKLKKDKWN